LPKFGQKKSEIRETDPRSTFAKSDDGRRRTFVRRVNPDVKVSLSFLGFLDTKRVVQPRTSTSRSKKKKGYLMHPSPSLSIPTTNHKAQNHQKWTTQEGRFTTPAFPFSSKMFFFFKALFPVVTRQHVNIITSNAKEKSPPVKGTFTLFPLRRALPSGATTG